MILPIVGYGHPMLKKVAEPISKDYEGLDTLIKDMYETVKKTDGCGLAAPQVNQSIRLFIIDTEGIKQVPSVTRKTFINPQILDTFGEDKRYKEGCLSLPGLGEEIVRPDGIHIRYLDENFEEHTEEYTGIMSRIIQHEYDHLEGHTYIDRISPIRKTLLQSKLRDIMEGRCKVGYSMIFMKKKRK